MGRGAYGAAVAAPTEELRSIMSGAQRSKHTHERGVEKCLSLIKTTPEIFASAPADEGGFYEHVTRVLVAKKRDGGVERCLAFVARVCSGAVLTGDDQQGDVARRSLLWLAKACSAADKTARGRALEVIALILERLIGEDGAEVGNVDIALLESPGAAPAASCVAPLDPARVSRGRPRAIRRPRCPA